ncbi:MAG TPA: methionine--tRNA ligase subunit beta [Acidobacteriota bacterium]|nr:methionine--tRNA ligase subunit beta [Acidobacteriota bacterium]
MAKDMISFKEFQDIELRAARVLTAERVEGTDKLMQMQIDLGSEQRQIVAGIAQDYTPEEMVGKNIMVVANLQPAKIRGVESNGMLLAANLDGKPILATFDKEVPPGTPIT